MGEFDVTKSTTSQLNNAGLDFNVAAQVPDESGTQTETYWDFPDSNQYLGYYQEIPELKKAIDALAMWVSGQGYQSDTRTQALLDFVDGWGEDSIEAIINNLIIQKKVFGDAFAEIIRDDEDGQIINIKPLYPGNMRVVVNEKGIIKRYEHRTKVNKLNVVEKLSPNKVLHLCNDRIANEIHGTSVIKACKWVIDARNEAMADWRRISHRSTIRVLYVDIDDTTKLNELRNQYKEGIRNGEVLILPGKKGDMEFEDLTLPNHEAFLAWIRYLENFFYQALGIPKVILGGSEEFTEASSKIGYLTFEQVYSKEQRELEADLWKQLGLRIKFNKPVSLKNELLQSEGKNTGQTGFQPSDTTASLTRNE